MAEQLVTRATIRRSIGRELQEEFFLRYGGLGYITPSTTSPGDTTFIASTDQLFQENDFWRGAWVYNASTDAERLVDGFDAANHRIYVEWPFTNAPSTLDQIELWGMWPPSAVHRAINMAIRPSWQFFPNVVDAETIVVQEDRMRYGILSSDLTQTLDDDYPSVGAVLQIWLEKSSNVIRGQVTIGSSLDAFTDSDATATTDLDSDWFVSIYSGPGAGQLREAASGDSDGLITPSTAWVTSPTTDSKYAIWHPEQGEQVDDWYRVTAARFDQPENPSEVFFTRLYNSVAGLRMRIKYMAQSTDLAADSDESVAPENYLVFRAISHLYSGLAGNNRSDRAMSASLAEHYERLANDYIMTAHRQLPAGTLWGEYDPGNLTDETWFNPLDW